MKIIYTSQNYEPIRLILSDEVVTRVKEWNDALSKIKVKENESVSCEIKIGGPEWAVGEDNVHRIVEHYNPNCPIQIKEGYDYKGRHENRPPIVENGFCWIDISARGSAILTSGEEGSDQLIEWEQNIPDLPDVYFSENFIRNAAGHKYEEFGPHNQLAIELFYKEFMTQEHRDMMNVKADAWFENQKKLDEEFNKKYK